MATLRELRAKQQARKKNLLTAKEEHAVNKTEEKPTGGGLRLSAQRELEEKTQEIARVIGNNSSPKTFSPMTEGRELGSFSATGERLPLVHPNDKSTSNEQAWFQALHSLEANLCIVIEPNSDHAWIALDHPPHSISPLPPLLLQRLPLANRQIEDNPF